MCPDCKDCAPTLKISILDENLEEKWITKSNNGFNYPITYMVKEKSGYCTIKFENGEKVKHVRLNIVPFCNLGLTGLPKGRCSKFNPRRP